MKRRPSLNLPIGYCDTREHRRVSLEPDGLGFPSAQHFATTFKRVVGVSPSAWRVRKNAKA